MTESKSRVFTMATVKDRSTILPSNVFHSKFCVIPNGYGGSKQFGCLSRFDISVGISHKKNKTAGSHWDINQLARRYAAFKSLGL